MAHEEKNILSHPRRAHHQDRVSGLGSRPDQILYTCVYSFYLPFELSISQLLQPPLQTVSASLSLRSTLVLMLASTLYSMKGMTLQISSLLRRQRKWKLSARTHNLPQLASSYRFLSFEDSTSLVPLPRTVMYAKYSK